MPWIELNGVSIHYQVEGDKGPAVVLLHEMGGTLQSWDGVVPGLSDRYRVLRYDQRGSGLSEKPRGPLGIETAVDDLEALTNELSIPAPFHLVAIAAATLPAVIMASRHQDLVASLILCNPVIGVAKSRAAQLEERADLSEKEGMRSSLSVTLDRSYPPTMGDPETYDQYRGRYLANDPYCFAQMNRMLAQTSIVDLVPHIRCPTMIVAGKFDEVRPPSGSEEFARKIPGAQFALIESGHMMAVQAPIPLLAVIDEFLSGLTGRVAAEGAVVEGGEVASTR